jgi:predicted metal-binding transcription factor (methanogenesis marker protein 9)
MKVQMITRAVFILFFFATLTGCSPAVDSQVPPQQFFPGRNGFDLKKINISDADNNSLDFKRVDCVWVIGAENRSSDEARVTALADKLVTLASRELVTHKSDRYRDFKVSDVNFSRKVVLTFKDNTSFTLLLGTPAITKPIYVRRADTKEVFAVDESLLRQISLKSNSWLAAVQG